MTSIVTPPTIDPLPPAPQPTDTPAEFDTKSFASLAAQVAFVSQANASAAATNQNAVATNERSTAAAGAASAAATSEANALAYRNTASTAATTATAKAAEADASAVAASKLNLGDKAAPPTTDNQGQPLRAGATYYDTTLGKWRVWSGTAWGDGVSAVAGVSSFNGRTGAINDGVVQNTPAANANLNTVITSGFYDFGAPAANGPAGVTASQLVVSRGGSTAFQIVIDKASGAMFVRGASGLGGAPVWSAWRRVSNQNDVVVPLAGGAMDCSLGNRFTETVNGARTFAFSNVPDGAYACVLEINHISGTMTLPAGSVWVGAVPTFTTGKRHLFYFERAQLGTAGWYVSALPGFPA